VKSEATAPSSEERVPADARKDAIYQHYCTWCRSLGIKPATREQYFLATRWMG
jgi:hypothetical protein